MEIGYYILMIGMLIGAGIFFYQGVQFGGEEMGDILSAFSYWTMGLGALTVSYYSYKNTKVNGNTNTQER